jgi:hypothetical protein
MTRHLSHLALLLPLLAACPGGSSGGLPEIIDVRKVSSAGGAPEVTKISDLGTGQVPRRGVLKASHSDGVGVIGELLYIQGSDFGKQPRITLGGRATAVLGHTADGVVVRVPWGIDPGDVDLEVSNGRGRTSTKYGVKRVGLVLDGQQMLAFSVGAKGEVTIGDKAPLAGAQRMVFSPDGSVAYVGGAAGGKVTVWVVDLTAPTPKVVTTQTFPGSKLIDLETAEQADLGLVVTDTHLAYFDSRQVLNPAFYAPLPLPKELTAKTILAAAVGGQGRSVALLLSDLNKLAVIDAGPKKELSQPELIDVLPEARLQLVSDLRFSADGRTVWVASGDTARSMEGGFQPNSLTLIQVTPTDAGSKRKLSVHASWKLGEKLSAAALAKGRGEPIPPGTSIRSAPASAMVYMASYQSELIKAGIDKFGKGGDWTSRVTRAGLGQQDGEEVATGPWLLTALDVVGKSEVLVALGCKVDGGKLERILVHGRVWRASKPKATVIGPLNDALLTRKPLWLGEVKAQP